MLTTLLLIIGLNTTDTIPARYSIGIGPIPREVWRLAAKPQIDVTKCYPCSSVDTNCSYYSFHVWPDTWATICDSSRIVIQGDTAKLIKELIKAVQNYSEQDRNKKQPSLIVSYYRNHKLIKNSTGSNVYTLTGPGIKNHPLSANGILIKTDSIRIISISK